MHTKRAVLPKRFPRPSVSPAPDPSPRRSVTRARRIYVSRLANFRSSDRPQTRGRALASDDAHEACRPPQTFPPSLRLSVPRPEPGTQCDTSATYLRKQISKLPFKRPTPDTGQCTRSLLAILGYRDTRPSLASGCALPATAPRMAHLPGTPHPKARRLNG